MGTSPAALSVSTPLSRGWNARGYRVRGGGTLLGCEAARSSGTLFQGCAAGPPDHDCPWDGVVGVGLFLENCIVDASIL